jgi:CHAT domain-containing protein
MLKQYVGFSGAGQWEQAARQADRILVFVQARFPKRLEYNGLVWVAQSRNGLGRYEEGLKLYEEALAQLRQVRPESDKERQLQAISIGEALRGAGISLQLLGRLKEAIPYGQASVQWLQQNGQPASAADAQKSLAQIYHEAGDNESAIAAYRQAVATLEPIAAREDTPGMQSFTLAESLRGLADCYSDLGRDDLAEPMARRALELMVAVNGWQHRKTAEVLNTLGFIYNAEGRREEAKAHYRAALTAFEAAQGPQHPITANTMMNLAGLLSDDGKLDEAQALMRRGLSVFEARFGRVHPRTAFVLVNLALTLQQMGEQEQQEAGKLLQEALAIYEKTLGPTHDETANAIVALALLRTRQENNEDAMRYLDRMAEIHAKEPLGGVNTHRLHAVRAIVLWKLNKAQDAIREATMAIEQAEVLRAYSAGGERERAVAFEQYGADFETLIGWQAELNNVPELFLAIERMKARSFMDELRLRHVDLLAGLSDAERRRFAQRESKLRRELTEAETRFREFAEDEANLSADLVAKRREAAAAVLRARDALYQYTVDVRAASPAYRQLITNKAEPATLQQVQQSLGDDELVLCYSVNDESCYVVAVGRDGATFTALKVDEQTARSLGIEPGMLTRDSLRRVLLDSSGILPHLSSPKRSEGTTDSKLALLWQVLIPEPQRAALTNGNVKLLTVLPDGPLAMLPFETLVVSNGPEPEYLLDAGPPIAYAPSASVLLNLAAREPSQSIKNEPVLTLGDPAYPRSQGAAPDAIARKLGTVRAAQGFRAGLAPLPYTGWEAKWVEESFAKAALKCVKLTGTQATEAAIRREAPGRQILHLACHGMADQSYGNFFGSLAVTPGRAGDPSDDGFLTMAEIYELNLAGCELAILSACETNFGPQQQGEGVWALSRGFLVAGARRVVASNWVVDDEAGATLVSYFVNYLAAKNDAAARDYANSLHAAKKQLRKSDKWRHPFYWSTLVLVGPK